MGGGLLQSGGVGDEDLPPLITGVLLHLTLGELHGQPFVDHHAGVDVSTQPIGFEDLHLAVDEEGGGGGTFSKRRCGDVDLRWDVPMVLQPLDLHVLRLESPNQTSQGDLLVGHLLRVGREDEDQRWGDLA